MGSELIYRGHEAQTVSDTYSPKPHKPWLSVIRPIRYLLREQRLIFVLVGIAIATLVFTLLHSTNNGPYGNGYNPISETNLIAESTHQPNRFLFHPSRVNSEGKIPLGLKRKVLRIVVTGGAGFVGSQLVDRLIGRGDSVIVADNFFTGRKENVMHHFGNPRFELIRHDVVEPLLLEVDQIYHLACPASPVHYKFNPVKTIKTNVVGTLNMLGLAKRVGARFLLTSTSQVYGDPLQHPQVETYWGNVNPIGVRSCYDEGKRTAETLTMDYHRGAGVEAQRIRKVGGKSESGVGEKTMGLTDSINSAADVVKQNVPGLTSIKDACRSTYDLGWTAVGKLSSAAGSLKPDLAPVKSAYLASYDCGWTAADKVSKAVRRVVGVTVTPYLPDEEGKARISQLATILAKNTGQYAFREGFKLVPGGGVFYEIVTRSIREEKKPQDDYKATIETLQARIDRLEKQSRGSAKLASSQAMIGHRAEPDSGKPLPGGVYQAQSQIFKMKELFGRRSG